MKQPALVRIRRAHPFVNHSKNSSCTSGIRSRKRCTVCGRNVSATHGAWLAQVAHGVDEMPVRVSSKPKLISRETTFERDMHPLHDRAALSKFFTDLCTRVAEDQDLRRKGYVGRTVGLKLRSTQLPSVHKCR